MKQIEKRDLRWIDPQTGERVSYVESLKAELRYKNSWIYPREWSEIEKMIDEGISEEEAKEQCHVLHQKIKERVEFDRRLYE